MRYRLDERGITTGIGAALRFRSDFLLFDDHGKASFSNAHSMESGLHGLDVHNKYHVYILLFISLPCTFAS
jgi:hypothetical protein